jgi:hypothetical protein
MLCDRCGGEKSHSNSERPNCTFRFEFVCDRPFLSDCFYRPGHNRARVLDVIEIRKPQQHQRKIACYGDNQP